jgi:hypothetical protein
MFINLSFLQITHDSDLMNRLLVKSVQILYIMYQGHRCPVSAYVTWSFSSRNTPKQADVWKVVSFCVLWEVQFVCVLFIDVIMA